MRTNRPFFETKYKLIGYTVRHSFNFDVVYCLAHTVHCPALSFLSGFFHIFHRDAEWNTKNTWNPNRDNLIQYSLFYCQSKKCVSVWPRCSLKRYFFHLMICHEFMTRISSRIEIYFCCFTKISPLIARTHYTCNLYAWTDSCSE